MTPILTRSQPPAPASETKPAAATHSGTGAHARHVHAHSPTPRATHSPLTALVVGAAPRVAAAALASALLWLVVVWALS